MYVYPEYMCQLGVDCVSLFTFIFLSACVPGTHLDNGEDYILFYDIYSLLHVRTWYTCYRLGIMLSHFLEFMPPSVCVPGTQLLLGETF